MSRGARQARRNASNGGQDREGQESGERARARTTSQEAEEKRVRQTVQPRPEEKREETRSPTPQEETRNRGRNTEAKRQQPSNRWERALAA